jgi:hypothetical protein
MMTTRTLPAFVPVPGLPVNSTWAVFALVSVIGTFCSLMPISLLTKASLRGQNTPVGLAPGCSAAMLGAAGVAARGAPLLA